MANNKVSIDLELKGDKLVAKGLDNVGDAADKTGDDLEKMGKQSKKTGDDLEGMAKDAGFLDKKIVELRGQIDGLIKDFDRTGDSAALKKISAAKRELGQLSALKPVTAGALKPVTVEVETLDKRITEVRRNIGQLALQFSKTGDKGLLGKIGDSKSELGMLTKLRKQMFDLGQEGAEHFGEALTASMRALKGPGIAALVAVAAAATPFLGAAISSAIIGGVGLGGIIGGVALAARDPRVQSAGKVLGEHALSAFESSAEPFVQPVIDALGMLSPIVDDVAASLREAFAGVAPVLGPLTKGLGGLIQEMMPGLIATMNSARPVLLTIANEMPKIGAAIGYFFQIISRDPRGAIMAFQDLSRIIQVTLILTGRFLMAMSTIWAKVSPFIQAATGHMDVAAAKIGDAGLAMEEANRLGGELTGGLKEMGDSASAAERRMSELNDAIERFFGIAMNSERATIAYQRAWDEMVDGLHEGTRTLDVTTEAGRKHREQILDVIDASMKMHDARVREGMDVQQSLAIYDQDIERLRFRAEAIGYTEKQLDELMRTARDMPELVAFQVEAPGLELTLEQAKELLRVSRELGSAIRVGAVGGVTVGGKRAAGGPVAAGQAYLVGEQGPEILMTGSSGRVYSNADSAAMMSGASGGSAPSVSLNVQVQRTGDRLGDALMQALAYELRVTGGVVGGYRIPSLNDPAFT